MSDIFKEINQQLGGRTSKLEARIRLGWRFIIAWIILCGLVAFGVFYTIIHFIVKFW